MYGVVYRWLPQGCHPQPGYDGAEVTHHHILIHGLQLHELVDVVDEGEEDDEDDVSHAFTGASLNNQTQSMNCCQISFLNI